MSANAKILIVDDDNTNLEILSERLEDEGFKVINASSGEEALEILNQEEGVNMVILDWMMPGISGIEVLQTMKSDGRFKDIPVIMQTAKAYSEDMVKGIEAGACQYLTKPFSKKVLISLVHSTLQQSSKLGKLEMEMEKQKKFLQGCAARMMKRQEDMRFDLQTYQTFNQFFLLSPNCKSHDELTTLLLNTIKQFSFDSAGKDAASRKLRCSVRLTGEAEVDISDRGMQSSMDKLILKKAMTSGQVIQNGTYSAIPSTSNRTAVLLRNTPVDEKESEKALGVISILIERFEERLLNLENKQDIISKNKVLLKKSNQFQRIIHSCSKELAHVNKTYQEMKTKQMELLEEIAGKIIVKVPDLNGQQIEHIKKITGQELIKSMELYSTDQITDQKFENTIKKLNELLSDTIKTPENEEMGHITQEEVDKLMASLGH